MTPLQEKEKSHFAEFVTEDIAEYIARKRLPQVFGNNLEIQACSEIYNRPIEVYSGVTGDSKLAFLVVFSAITYASFCRAVEHLPRTVQDGQFAHSAELSLWQPLQLCL